MLQPAPGSRCSPFAAEHETCSVAGVRLAGLLSSQTKVRIPDLFLLACLCGEGPVRTGSQPSTCRICPSVPARKHNTQYQRMIRRLLDAHAEHHSRRLTPRSTGTHAGTACAG